jgi:hypothetical protein
MAFAGIRAFLELSDGGAPGTKVDVSNWLDGITPSSDTDELDGTTFQPGVAAPTKQIIAGFRTRALSLSAKWTPEAETFFSGIEGKTGLSYTYGPLGSDTGMTGITGVCNCLSWTGPISTVDGVITATCELRCDTRVLGTFDATGVVTPVGAAATGATAGLPGTFTPSGAVTPANQAALGSVVASPAAAWTGGQYVATADAQHVFWDGSGWMVGNAP